MIEVKYIGTTHISIHDTEDNVTIYEGPKTCDCIIESICCYFGGEEVLYTNEEMSNHDPLDTSLDSIRKQREKEDEEQDNLDDQNDGDNESTVECGPSEDDLKNDWPDDDD